MIGPMHVALWVFSMGLAAAFAAAGATKLVLSKNELVLRGASWVGDFTLGTVRLVGLTEVLAALGMTLPVFLNIPEGWALAAGVAGLIVVSLGAAVIHARRREPVMIAMNVVLLALAVMSVWGRR
ncbi:hypothetical protein MSAS_18820 [Mycobacterium saskatchewanense]|nr:hypothetical protein MSAS_18820 [Mycobacterium saskatchewanense]